MKVVVTHATGTAPSACRRSHRDEPLASENCLRTSVYWLRARATVHSFGSVVQLSLMLISFLDLLRSRRKKNPRTPSQAKGDFILTFLAGIWHISLPVDPQSGYQISHIHLPTPLARSRPNYQAAGFALPAAFKWQKIAGGDSPIWAAGAGPFSTFRPFSRRVGLENKPPWRHGKNTKHAAVSPKLLKKTHFRWV